MIQEYDLNIPNISWVIGGNDDSSFAHICLREKEGHSGLPKI